MDRKPRSYRFTQKTIDLLEVIHRKAGMSKEDCIAEALVVYAEKLGLSKHNHEPTLKKLQDKIERQEKILAYLAHKHFCDEFTPSADMTAIDKEIDRISKKTIGANQAREESKLLKFYFDSGIEIRAYRLSRKYSDEC